MTTAFRINNARLSFPHLAQPHASAPNAEPKYGALLLLPNEDPQVAQVQQAAMAAAAEVFGERAQQVMTAAANDPRLRTFGPGETKVQQATGEPWDGFAGHVFINTSNKFMPQMIQADGTPIDPADTMMSQQEARKLYGGCYVNAAIQPWVQNNQHGRCVRWNLIAVQFAKEGKAFGDGGRVDVSGMFGATPAGAAAPLGASAMPAAMPAAMQPPGPTPVQGADGNWYDPATGQQVQAPAMPGYGG